MEIGAEWNLAAPIMQKNASQIMDIFGGLSWLPIGLCGVEMIYILIKVNGASTGDFTLTIQRSQLK